jgi:hypothetical protein
MPQFFFAIGRAPSARDWAVCRLVGQRHFLVPAGSPAERTLRTMPDVSAILDSGAYPPHNPQRPTLEQYAWIVRWWSRHPDRFAWAASYDTMGDPHRTDRDHETLLRFPWCDDDIPIVRVRAYPFTSAGAILDDITTTRDCLDPDERAQYDQLLACGQLEAHSGRPACAVGGLAVARYTRESTVWYRRLLSDLERVADSLVDVSECRLHLFGIGRPDWVQHPLVQSFDSSAPARLAGIGGWDAVRRYNDPAFGLSLAKLRRSREARLALFLGVYQRIAGQPWQPIDEALLRDDDARPDTFAIQLRLAV